MTLTSIKEVLTFRLPWTCIAAVRTPLRPLTSRASASVNSVPSNHIHAKAAAKGRGAAKLRKPSTSLKSVTRLSSADVYTRVNRVADISAPVLNHTASPRVMLRSVTQTANRAAHKGGAAILKMPAYLTLRCSKGCLTVPSAVSVLKCVTSDPLPSLTSANISSDRAINGGSRAM